MRNLIGLSRIGVLRCEGYGHKVSKCPARLKKDGKKLIAYSASLSDSDPKEGEISPNEIKFVTFLACHVSANDKSSHEDSHVHDTSEAVESSHPECLRVKRVRKRRSM